MYCFLLVFCSRHTAPVLDLQQNRPRHTGQYKSFDMGLLSLVLISKLTLWPVCVPSDFLPVERYSWLIVSVIKWTQRARVVWNSCQWHYKPAIKGYRARAITVASLRLSWESLGVKCGTPFILENWNAGKKFPLKTKTSVKYVTVIVWKQSLPCIRRNMVQKQGAWQDQCRLAEVSPIRKNT